MDLKKLNSATKYPPIPTYHGLGERGSLTEERTGFESVSETPVVLTEKVDGTNGRIVFLSDGDYFIGSRENLLYAKGDRIGDPAQGIVDALKPLADYLSATHTLRSTVFSTIYLEVYGGKVGSNAKQYSSTGEVGYRMFDYRETPADVLECPLEEISRHRDMASSEEWLTESELRDLSAEFRIPMTTRLGVVDSASLPTTTLGMHQWLKDALPTTYVALDEGAGGRPEGIVLRTPGRSVIAKARFEDYERTAKRRK